MKVIAGNWKMNMGPAETRAYFEALELAGVPEDRRVIVFLPAVSLRAGVDTPGRDRRILLGVQNIHWEARGAFTGETSALLAAAAGATYCLVGHSERRHLFGETDEEVAKKIRAAKEALLVPLLCVGETLSERKAGRVEEVIVRQLEAALPVLGDGRAEVLVAYEPVWAIGTGETATPSDASAAHGTLRARLIEAWGERVARGVPILYGGSVKADNASDLLSAPDVDGVLVGGASLEPASFAAIARSAA